MLSFYRFSKKADGQSDQGRQKDAQEKRPFFPDLSFLSYLFRNHQCKDVPEGENDAEPHDVHDAGILVKENQKKDYRNDDAKDRQPGTAARNAFHTPDEEQAGDCQDDEGPGKDIGDPGPANLRIIMQVVHFPEKRTAIDPFQQSIPGFRINDGRTAFQENLDPAAFREIMIFIAIILPQLLQDGPDFRLGNLWM